MSIINNITLDQGADFYYSVSLVDTANAAIDLTGYSGNSQLRKSYTSNTYTAVTVDIPDPTNGVVTLSMNSATTANLTSSRYLYDLELKSSSNVVSRIMEGFITVNPNITR